VLLRYYRNIGFPAIVRFCCFVIVVVSAVCKILFVLGINNLLVYSALNRFEIYYVFQGNYPES